MYISKQKGINLTFCTSDKEYLKGFFIDLRKQLPKGTEYKSYGIGTGLQDIKKTKILQEISNPSINNL